MARSETSLFDPPKPAKARSAASDRPAHPQSLNTAAVICDSIEAADLALSEIGRLDALEAKLKAECDRELNAVRAKWAGKMIVGVVGRDLQIVDRRAELSAAIEEWAEENKAELLGDRSKKSLDLNHGTIGWRSSAEKLVPLEGAPVTGNEMILEGIRRCLRKAAEAFRLFKVGCLQFITFDVHFDKKALLAARQKEQISEKELTTVGFEIAPNEDRFFCKANAAKIESVSANATG